MLRGVTCRTSPATASTVTCAGLPDLPAVVQPAPRLVSVGQPDACFYASTVTHLRAPSPVMCLSQICFQLRIQLLPEQQGRCIINYDGSPTISDDTGDDMFKLPKNSNAFFEYQSIGGINDADRLRYIARSVRIGQRLNGPFRPLLAALL